ADGCERRRYMKVRFGSLRINPTDPLHVGNTSGTFSIFSTVDTQVKPVCGTRPHEACLLKSADRDRSLNSISVPCPPYSGFQPRHVPVFVELPVKGRLIIQNIVIRTDLQAIVI